MRLNKITDDRAMPVFAHLRELRRRLVISGIALLIGSCVAYAIYNPIIDLLTASFQNLAKPGGNGSYLFVNSLLEGFVTKFKISILSGAVLSAPVHLLNILQFIFPACSRKEKLIITLSIATSFLLGGLGLYVSYFTIIPLAVHMLTSVGFIPGNVGILLNYQQNVFYVFNIIFYFIIIFQLPILLEILLYLNIIKRKPLMKYGRYVIIGILILAAIVTPPDFISQLGLAIPLVLLFYLTILVARIFRFGEG